MLLHETSFYSFFAKFLKNLMFRQILLKFTLEDHRYRSIPFMDSYEKEMICHVNRCSTLYLIFHWKFYYSKKYINEINL